MVDLKLNKTKKSLANNPKQQNPNRNFIFNIIMFLILLTYLWSVHHIFLENLKYVEHFFKIKNDLPTVILDTLLVTNEFFPKLVTTKLFKWFKEFPKYNLYLYVVFAVISFLVCIDYCFWTCVFTITEELIIGWFFHFLMHDKQNDFIKCKSSINKFLNFFKR